MKRPPKRKRRPGKPVVNPEFHSIHHSAYIGLTEEAFTAAGVTYYNFKADAEIPMGRYMYIQNFLQEALYRMDRGRLMAYISKIRSEIDGSRKDKDGTPLVNFGNAIAYLDQMKNLTELAFEPDTVYRLASVIYFDAHEDLTKWDKVHNESKIAAWKQEGTLDFFYGRPFIELIGWKGMSETDLRDCIEKFQNLTDKYNTVLNSETQTQ